MTHNKISISTKSLLEENLGIRLHFKRQSHAILHQ